MRRVIQTSVVVVGLLMLPSPVAAQASFARGWIDVNLGVATAAEPEFAMTWAEIRTQEVARARADFHLPAGASFDFGGGVMFNRTVGLGVSFTGTAHQDPAALGIDVPHPFFFNAFAADAAVTDRALTRQEGGASIQVMIVAADRERFRLRVFGGPTHFRVEQEALDAIEFDQAFLFLLPVNAVEITGFRAATSEGTGWGGHVGADASYFFTRVVGIGGFVRTMFGSVEIDNPLGGGTIDVNTGGVQLGGGLRLRF